jgi:hypothetical protein
MHDPREPIPSRPGPYQVVKSDDWKDFDDFFDSRPAEDKNTKRLEACRSVVDPELSPVAVSHAFAFSYGFLFASIIWSVLGWISN